MLDVWQDQDLDLDLDLGLRKRGSSRWAAAAGGAGMWLCVPASLLLLLLLCDGFVGWVLEYVSKGGGFVCVFCVLLERAVCVSVNNFFF